MSIGNWYFLADRVRDNESILEFLCEEIKKREEVIVSFYRSKSHKGTMFLAVSNPEKVMENPNLVENTFDPEDYDTEPAFFAAVSEGVYGQV